MGQSEEFICSTTKDEDSSILIFSAESKNNDIKFFSQRVVDEKTVLTTEFSSQKIDREYAREVLMILCKEKVDPIHLASIIEDIEADL